MSINSTSIVNRSSVENKRKFCSTYHEGSLRRERKMSSQICSAVAPCSLDAGKNIVRQSANYSPNIWADCTFTSSMDDHATIHPWSEEADVLKERIKEMLNNGFFRQTLQEQLDLVDVVQRLGIAYHFEGEIKEAMKHIFNNHIVNDDNLDLKTSSLQFRLLREHGYNVSCGIFNKFKDNKGSFKEDIGEDIIGVLNLYEAAYLRLKGEDILEDALVFTKAHLQAMVSHNLEQPLAKHVLHALKHPIRKTLPRVAAREFMALYQESKLHNEILLKFAKLDFNILQNQHQKELCHNSKWWKNLEVETRFPYARDRFTECYFWAMGVCYEPQYVLARKFFTKVIALCSIVDDTFDVYGTAEELELFTKAFVSSEISAVERLPMYMRVWYQTVQEVYNEMDEEIGKEGRSYVKEAMKGGVKAQHEESKWLHRNKIPTMEEYMEIALVTTFYQTLAITSLVGVGEFATKESFEWLMKGPKMLQAACLICRLMDDIVSHQFEQQRKHVPSAVECYMNQYGVSKEQAYDEFNKQVEDAWSDINEAFLDSNAPPMCVLMRVLNLARVMDLLYKEDDGYTHSKKTRHYVTSLLVDPVEI